MPPQTSPHPASSSPPIKTVRDLLREERRALIVDQRASRTTAAVWRATAVRRGRCGALTGRAQQAARDLSSQDSPFDAFRTAMLEGLESLMNATKLEWTGADLYSEEVRLL